MYDTWYELTRFSRTPEYLTPMKYRMNTISVTKACHDSIGQILTRIWCSRELDPKGRNPKSS